MIPTQILRVLFTIRRYDVRALLMGGQACVLYGAAEYSRDLDLAVLATPEAPPVLRAALEALNAAVIAVPSFDVRYLDRGHAVHFSIPDGSSSPLRVDIMSRPAARSSRSVVRAALAHDDMDVALAAEQAQIMVEDRAYWAPLRRELEALRFEARRMRE